MFDEVFSEKDMKLHKIFHYLSDKVCKETHKMSHFIKFLDENFGVIYEDINTDFKKFSSFLDRDESEQILRTVCTKVYEAQTF